MNSEWQSLQPQTQQELKNTMNAMQPPQSVEEIKAGLETTEKGGVRQSIRNCLTVFQRDPLLSGAIAYNILTDRKDIIYDSFLLCRNSIRKDLSHIAHNRRNVRFNGLRRVHTPPQPLNAHTAAHRANGAGN